MSDSADRPAEASIEHLLRLFTVPEAADSTLARIERALTANLADFLGDHVVATARSLAEIEADLADTRLPEAPTFVSDQADFLLDKVVAESVHTAAPGFVGHMYARDDAFYAARLHDPAHALGAFGSGGTVANLTALWVARNRAFPATGEFPGVARTGFAAALRHHDLAGGVVLVSERGHYSLAKAADVLGIGRDQLVAVATDRDDRVRPDAVAGACRDWEARGYRVLAIVGVAGTTETGRVDSLDALADIAADHGTHFHVDAAWGGPTLFSPRYRGRLAGIARADSVTLDAHKQLYVPLGCGIALFRDPQALSAIEHHAAYVIREGSRDLGSRTLEGSRPGMALLVHSGLRVFGRQGYALLIEQGIDRARDFAARIEAAPDFELVTAPELNILTYRYAPAWWQAAWQAADATQRARLDKGLNTVTVALQRRQRERGQSFVSRTTLQFDDRQSNVTVFRVVLANPLTTMEILDGILEEQRLLATEPPIAERLEGLRALVADGL
jgi:glutamate decarboxylase